MHKLPKSTRLVCWLILLLPSIHGFAANQGAEIQAEGAPLVTDWSSSEAEHMYGLPGAIAKEKGTLRITVNDLVFAGKTSSATIRLQSILAASAGNERVELWGMKGRLLRMAMPNGSGLLAAAVMHHRVDMFTVEFSDKNGGYHAAVFFLPANEAERALQTITTAPISHREPASNVCEQGPVRFRTVRVPLPIWNDLDVPAAYRALVYEHLIEGLGRVKGIDHVYRDGEEGCSQFTVQLSVTDFKPGSQVGRASMGPVGMFVGTTQMVFGLRITDDGGNLDFHDQIKATVRGESESTKVAESVVKKVVKKFVVSQKRISGGYPAGTGSPYSR
jgi:hypothetical protein